jgi:cardiolipin synthase
MIALIGSANLDARSFWLNFESTLFIYDDDFASVLRFMQTGYLRECTRMHLQEWRARPRWRVFVENCAQLLGPLL